MIDLTYEPPPDVVACLPSLPMLSGTCAEWATAGITLAAVGIALGTLKALLKQVTANEIAAIAAKDNALAALKQAEAITQSERAYVFAKVVFVQRYEKVNGMLRYRTEFKNYGKTPANVISVDRDSYLITTPKNLQYFLLTDQRWVYPDGLVIAGGLEWNGTKSVIIKEGWPEIIEDKMRFYCIGLIRYRDVFGDHWETGYCWEYVARQNRFKVCEDPEARHLNYCRAYTPPDSPSS